MPFVVMYFVFRRVSKNQRGDDDAHAHKGLAKVLFHRPTVYQFFTCFCRKTFSHLDLNQTEFMDKLLIPLFTGLVGLWLGYRLNLGQTAISKRRHFLSVVKKLRDKIEATHLREFAFANHLTFDDTIKHLPELEREAVEVEQYIATRHQKSFISAFSAYKTLGQQIGDEQKNAPIKTQMLSVLDELLRCAK